MVDIGRGPDQPKQIINHLPFPAHTKISRSFDFNSKDVPVCSPFEATLIYGNDI